MFDGKVYKQCKGLAMGNHLAQVLAEIRTNHALHVAINNFDAETISFVYKYVDDIFSSIHADRIDSVKNEMSKITKMEITVTNENQDQDVEFLDCVHRRNPDGTVSSRWSKKVYSRLSIYHSFHPWSVKFNTVIEMIKKAFETTSPDFIELTKELLVDILKRSSYAEWFIIDNVHVNPPNAIESSFKIKGKLNIRYVSCPYYNPFFNDIKKNENNLDVKLAPRPSKNNRRLLFSQIKDERKQMMKKNAIFKISCKNCPFTHILTTKNFDIKRTINSISVDIRSPCFLHIRKFPNHSFHQEAEIIKAFYNYQDAQHSRHVQSKIMKICKI